MFGKRILVLAAHPDDEVVACAASITKARAEGAHVGIFYLTHGCLSEGALWRWQRRNYNNFLIKRRREAENVAQFLNLEMLGWAVRPARHLWRELKQVLNEVENVIDQFQPDQIWIPAYEGGNPDHDGLNAVGTKLKSRVSVIEFAEYNFFGGFPRSHTFISSDDTVHVFLLSSEEKALKRQALKLYASEKSNLFYVKTHQESYRQLYPYDYTRPPHQGRLWYERYRWVPFNHPRIDFTPSAEVSKAITEFLAV